MTVDVISHVEKGNFIGKCAESVQIFSTSFANYA